jgi:starch synthase
MACEAAVVASATGGIVEVVDDGVTGFLVPLEQAAGSIDPIDPEAFAAEFARRVNELIARPELAVQMGEAGRTRVIEHFAWPAIAERTVGVYREAIARSGAVPAANTASPAS